MLMHRNQLSVSIFFPAIRVRDMSMRVRCSRAIIIIYQSLCPTTNHQMPTADGRFLSHSFKNIFLRLNHTFPESKRPVCTVFSVSSSRCSVFRRRSRQLLMVEDANPTMDILDSVLVLHHDRFQHRPHRPRTVTIRELNEKERKKYCGGTKKIECDLTHMNAKNFFRLRWKDGVTMRPRYMIARAPKTLDTTKSFW